MKPEPMKHHPRPAYPTRIEAAQDAQLLERHVPPARPARGRRQRVGVFLAAGLCGCGKQQAAPGGQGGQAPVTATDGGTRPLAQPQDAGLSQRAAAVVAPVFEHGKGRGIAGCIVVAPPVFLSEEEALQVISEERRSRASSSRVTAWRSAV